MTTAVVDLVQHENGRWGIVRSEHRKYLVVARIERPDIERAWYRRHVVARISRVRHP